MKITEIRDKYNLYATVNTNVMQDVCDNMWDSVGFSRMCKIPYTLELYIEQNMKDHVRSNLRTIWSHLELEKL